MRPSDTSFTIKPIARIETSEGFAVAVDEPHREGLIGLDGFSHAVLIWVAHETDEGTHVIDKPYQQGPDRVGVFSTRSAARPNQLGVSVAPLVGVDVDEGTVRLAWVDALDGTPVVDIKPYFPSSDRVVQATTPSWCAHWPQSLEESATFDWESVFTEH